MNSKFNVALITCMKNIGGTEIATLRFSKLLNNYHHNVTLISSNGPLVEDIKAHGSKHFECDLYTRNPIKLLRNVFKIAFVINKEKIDILHCQMAFPVFQARLACFFSSKKSKVIWHSRGLKSSTYKFIPRIYNWLGVWCIANCKKEEQKLTRYGYSTEKITTIYNPLPAELEFCISSDRITSTILPITETLNIGTISRLSYDRGVDLAIDYFYKLLRQRRNCILHIAGDGPEIDNLIYKVKDLGISDNVRFLGKIHNQQDFYNSIDILWNPIRVTGDEGAGFGNTTIEAGIFCVPLISHDSCGISEIVVNDETGFLTNIGDSELFVEKTLKLASDPHLRRRVTNNLYAFITDSCAPKHIYSQLITFYQKTLL